MHVYIWVHSPDHVNTAIQLFLQVAPPTVAQLENRLGSQLELVDVTAEDHVHSRAESRVSNKVAPVQDLTPVEKTEL